MQFKTSNFWCKIFTNNQLKKLPSWCRRIAPFPGARSRGCCRDCRGTELGNPRAGHRSCPDLHTLLSAGICDMDIVQFYFFLEIRLEYLLSEMEDKWMIDLFFSYALNRISTIVLSIFLPHDKSIHPSFSSLIRLGSYILRRL